MAKHMGIDERKRIEFLLGCGMKVAQIAVEVGRPDSTVVREIIARRIDSDKRLGCSNRLCSRLDECMRKEFTGFGERLRKNQPRCFETCPDFFESHCPRLARSPYVCNGCESERNCPMRKKYYLAPGAQANYEGTLVNSRLGVRVGDEAVAAMDAVLSPCIRKGQSVRNVVANNPGTFGKTKVRTVYDWINGGLFHAKRHDQPFACSRSGRPKKAQETKADAKCRVGRTIREMWEWLKEHAGVVACELDTVIGSVSGKSPRYTCRLPKSRHLPFAHFSHVFGSGRRRIGKFQPVTDEVAHIRLDPIGPFGPNPCSLSFHKLKDKLSERNPARICAVSDILFNHRRNIQCYTHEAIPSLFLLWFGERE